MNELVLVVPRQSLEPLFQGFYPARAAEPDFVDPFYNQLIGDSFYMLRDKAECNPDYKQIIPQVVITCLNENSVFTLRRLSTQGEKRLHDKISLTVGGHINPVDKTRSSDPIYTAFQRELDEELILPHNYFSLIRPSILGYINDDSGTVQNDMPPVGQVHIGVLFHINLTGDSASKLAVKETDKMTGEWVDIDVAAQYYEKMESWSQIVYNVIKGIK